ncbi:hypothetical protein D3C81_1484270 [compost metagenome]
MKLTALQAVTKIDEIEDQISALFNGAEVLALRDVNAVSYHSRLLREMAQKLRTKQNTLKATLENITIETDIEEEEE